MTESITPAIKPSLEGPKNIEKPNINFSDYILNANNSKIGDFTRLFQVLGRLPENGAQNPLQAISANDVTALEFLNPNLLESFEYVDAFKKVSKEKDLKLAEVDGRVFAEHKTPFDQLEPAILTIEEED